MFHRLQKTICSTDFVPHHKRMIAKHASLTTAIADALLLSRETEVCKQVLKRGDVKLSIIIVNYRAWRYISRALEKLAPDFPPKVVVAAALGIEVVVPLRAVLLDRGEGRAVRVQQAGHPVAWQHLAALEVLDAGIIAAAESPSALIPIAFASLLVGALFDEAADDALGGLDARLDQFVHLLLRRRAVVARDLDVDIARDQRTLQRFQLVEDRLFEIDAADAGQLQQPGWDFRSDSLSDRVCPNTADVLVLVVETSHLNIKLEMRVILLVLQ